MPSFFTTTTVLATLGTATVGGVFYAFSTFIMAGLGRLPPEQGTAAMQQLNLTAVRPGLMIALFGTAAVVVVGAILGLTRGVDRRSVLVVLGAAAYLVGGIGVTAAVNVPMNDALATLDPAAPGTAAAWTDYLERWTAANHVRTGLSLVGAALLAASLLPTAGE